MVAILPGSIAVSPQVEEGSDAGEVPEEVEAVRDAFIAADVVVVDGEEGGEVGQAGEELRAEGGGGRAAMLVGPGNAT